MKMKALFVIRSLSVTRMSSHALTWSQISSHFFSLSYCRSSLTLSGGRFIEFYDGNNHTHTSQFPNDFSYFTHHKEVIKIHLLKVTQSIHIRYLIYSTMLATYKPSPKQTSPIKHTMCNPVWKHIEHDNQA